MFVFTPVLRCLALHLAVHIRLRRTRPVTGLGVIQAGVLGKSGGALSEAQVGVLPVPMSSGNQLLLPPHFAAPGFVLPHVSPAGSPLSVYQHPLLRVIRHTSGDAVSKLSASVCSLLQCVHLLSYWPSSLPSVFCLFLPMYSIKYKNSLHLCFKTF